VNKEYPWPEAHHAAPIPSTDRRIFFGFKPPLALCQGAVTERLQEPAPTKYSFIRLAAGQPNKRGGEGAFAVDSYAVMLSSAQSRKGAKKGIRTTRHSLRVVRTRRRSSLTPLAFGHPPLPSLPLYPAPPEPSPLDPKELKQGGSRWSCGGPSGHPRCGSPTGSSRHR
jgi:hypothetical protein